MKPFALVYLLAAVLGLGVVPLAAQDGSCPALVETALEAVGEACSGLGRNQVCYGYSQIEAEGWQAVDLVFEVPGDTVSVMDVSSLRTAPFNVAENIWGVAIMTLQVNLPDTLPGQNVTFVLFGDATLTAEEQADAALAPTTVITAESSGNINVRGGPGTNFAVVGSLPAGESVIVIGRTEAGDWLQVLFEGEAAWVFAELVAVTGDVASVPVSDGSAPLEPPAVPVETPLHAFRLTTGTGEPDCVEAPRDGLLVQVPRGLRVDFTMNGVEVSLGSTALFGLAEQGIEVTLFDGTAQLTAQAETRTVPAGFRATAQENAAPAEPEPYVYEQVQSAPVQLLPEPVTIPNVEPTGLVICVGAGGSVTVPHGQPLLLRYGWRELELALVETYMEAVTHTLTYDGQVIPLTSRVGPEESSLGGFVTNWFWTVTHPAPGQHDVVLTFTPPLTSAQFPDLGMERLDSMRCRVIVQ